MRKIKAALIIDAVLVGTGYLAYQLLLTSEAKQALHDGVKSVVRGVVLTLDAVEERRGLIVEDDQPLPNVINTNNDWSALGL